MMLRIGDFVLCKYYTGIHYIGKVIGFKGEYVVQVEICDDACAKRTFETDIIEIERDMIFEIDCSILQ